MELIASGAADVEAELEDMGLLMVVLSLIMVRQGAVYESKILTLQRGLCGTVAMIVALARAT
jgi:hypothetical protein